MGATKDDPKTYKTLFDLLKKQPSWGDKTAALLVKALYNIHVGFAKPLGFWKDVPKDISKEDEIFLPVDAVIFFIFKHLKLNECKTTFKGINHFIKLEMPKSSFEVWDDLWYWGYITQKVTSKKRSMVFNEEKYWNLLHSHKDQKNLADVRKLANRFIAILK